MARRRFQPPTWAWLLTAAALAAMLALGFWQLRRGEAKAELLDRYAAAQSALPVPLAVTSPTAPDQVLRVRARGSWIGTRQLLLDHQTHERQPGYHVWTPLALESGGIALVNRGWIAAGSGGAPPVPPPAAGGSVEVEGLWRALPEPGLRLAVDNCGGDTWPRVVHYPTAADLRCLYAASGASVANGANDAIVASGVLLLDPRAADGFVRQWRVAPKMPPGMHYAYALQWFAMALAVLVIFITLNLGKRP